MDQLTGEQAPHQEVVVRRRWPRALGWGLLGFLGLLVVALAVLWTQRRPLANDILAREMERRGVEASYKLDRVGLRTQQISNLVIGNPANPDLTARVAQVQMRIHLTGRVEIFRVVARGVRLKGRVVGRRVSWGQLDRLLPPPSGKPFTLPDLTVDVADTSIALAMPYGPLGVAVEGAGNLTGGFHGRLAAASPQLDAGRCALADMRANMRVSVSARRPRVSGPLSASSFRCPSSNIAIAQPRFEVDSRFSEALERFTGRGRMSAAALTAGVNGLAGMNADLTFAGEPTRILGTVKLAARGARLSEIQAERTRLEGSYLLNAAKGDITLVADYAAQNADLAPGLTAGFTRALSGAAKTPLEPLAAALRQGIEGATRNMDAVGSLRLVNFPGGGAVRIETANVRTASGARIQVGGGGDGITYYWPGSRLRIDGDLAVQGGGLPTARIALSQPRSGAPISGTVLTAPYAAGGARLALAPITFAAGRDGSTSIQTVALLDGPISGGEVRGLRVPINGRVGRGGGLEFGRGCSDVRFASLRLGGLRLGDTSLPVCATGQAIVYRAPGGGVQVGAGTSNLALNGRLGASPFALRSQRATFTGPEDFRLAGLNVRMGRPESPILLNANALTGTFGGSGIRGRFTGGDGVIGRVPIALSDMSGDWLLYRSRLTVGGALTASDRLEAPRFYPLRSEDVRFTLANDRIRATGTLRHPATGTRVTDVAIDHRLSTGTGGATLEVPGIAFGSRLQPEQLTRLTEGQIALVDGTIYGQGRIAWSGADPVTSTGEFSTDDLDLAAAFGPVTGIKGTMRFTDLLALQTAPGQTAQVASINPGILVENGLITYQLLPGQQVRVESGRWPFMGGQLILQETVLSLGRPSAKRLTFEVVGLDANRFVQSFEFKEIGATGIFDGVLPMTFDESGGRIVGGKLDSRAPGGSLSYNGVVNRANLGTMGNIAFNALRDLRFRSMIIRLDGDLAGEFATRLTIDGVALGGTTGTQRLIRRLTSRLPIRLNVTIRGPFRALIATAKSMRDPRAIISTTLDRPLEEIPGITTEVRRREEETSQTQTPVNENITPEPTTRSSP
jgi:hypothetical protein